MSSRMAITLVGALLIGVALGNSPERLETAAGIERGTTLAVPLVVAQYSPCPRKKCENEGE